MSAAAVDNGPMLAPSPLAENAQRNGDDNAHTIYNSTEHSRGSLAEDRTSPLSHSPEQRGALHRVTNMLKEKLSRKEDDSNGHSELYLNSADMKYPPPARNGREDFSPRYATDMLPENSKVLRGILQGHEFKEKPEDLADSDSDFMRNGVGDYDLDQDSVPSQPLSPGDLSDDLMSDQENDMNGVNARKIGGATEMDLSQDDDDSCQNLETNEAKRARVETIISSMRTSPPRTFGDSTMPVSCDSRRAKRKQYRPQQHDIYMMEEETPAKMRCLEKDVLQKQLRHMQEQLVHMQHRYQQLFDQESSHQSELSEFAELSDKRGASEEKVGPKPKTGQIRLSTEKTSTEGELGHFFKETSKMIKEQASSSSTKQQTSPVGREPPTDLDKLAKILKAEITNSVGSLVDSVVADFVDKQKKKSTGPEDQSKATETVHQKDQVNIVKPIVTSTSPASGSTSNLVNINNNTLKLSPTVDDAAETKTSRPKVTDRISHPSFEHPFSHKPFLDMVRAHPPLFAPPPYFPHIPSMQPLFGKEPEQTEALPLVVSTPKKKRTKVTDTRLSPRAARALLQDGLHHSPHGGMDLHDKPPHLHHPMLPEYHPPPLVPASLPTSVAIPNPSLQHSDVLAMYSHERGAFGEYKPRGHSPSLADHSSPVIGHTPSLTEQSFQMLKAEAESYEQAQAGQQHDATTFDGHPMTSTLTPMHLRKAKLMFFYVRYPSSSILKVYFPDVKFNKNNTAQLVKWFSNFREFFYIQMEKYARQAIAEGVKNVEDLHVSTDSELYRVLNLHYNRNNQIEVPDNFRLSVQSTLREFFRAIQAGKDMESSWKKAIYKVIARLDDNLPEYFKSPNWMEALNDNC